MCLGVFLKNGFHSADDETMFIHKVNAKEPSMALFAFEEENRHFIAVVCNYVLSSFGIEDRSKAVKLNKNFFCKIVP
jgi:hypothetical protein